MALTKPLGLVASYKYQDHALSSLTQGISVLIHHQLNVSLGPLYLDGTAFLQWEKWRTIEPPTSRALKR